MLPINVFPRNCWYVAAFSSAVAETPVARTICGDPVVLFRDADGRASALADRCPHRGMPLSRGECAAGLIRCPYHGLEFDAAGSCVKIPGQVQIPPAARVMSYPLVEKNALLWIWMGDPAKADIGLVPSHPYHDDPQWAWSPIFLPIQCDWQLLNDNLLDLTHLGYVHRKTIGGDPEAHTTYAQIQTAREGNSVQVRRWLADSNPPPFYSSAHTFSGRIDRWQEIDFVPGFIRIWSGGTDAGTGAYEGRRAGGVQFMGLHAVTPSTATSCYYHFSQSRNFALNAPPLHEKIHQGALMTLLEDKEILEAQQARVLEEPGRGFVDIKWDAAPLQARRIVDQLVVQEA